MNRAAVWFLALGLTALSLALLTAALTRRAHRRLLLRIHRMLDDATQGRWSSQSFDESALSSAESKLYHLLSAKSVGAEQLTQERDKIQSLIADISHQTKTPLSNILLYAQLLCEQPLPSQGRRCAESLAQQAEKLRFLIDALVKTSRLESGALVLRPRPTKVQPVLARAAEQARAMAEQKGIRLTVEPTDESAMLDEKWTAEAVYNLVDNAVKYTPRGGRVTLSAQRYPLFCRIDVTDTGMGVAPEEQGAIFQRFYRSPAVQEREGVGIGLYLTRQIVAAQGGYVKLSSRPGQGSRFSLFLPREQSCQN